MTEGRRQTRRTKNLTQSSGKDASFSQTACPSQATGSTPARNEGDVGTPQWGARARGPGRAERGTARGRRRVGSPARTHSWMSEGGAAPSTHSSSCHTLPACSHLFPRFPRQPCAQLPVPTPRILQRSGSSCRDSGANVQKPTSTGTTVSPQHIHTHAHTHTCAYTHIELSSAPGHRWGFRGAEAPLSSANSTTTWDKVLSSCYKALDKGGQMTAKVRRQSLRTR